MIFKQEPRIEIIDSWKKGGGYFADGVLVYVEHGKELLREVMFDDNEEKSALTLMLGDKSLFQLQGDGYFCPTCEKIVKSGYNLEKTQEFDFDAINSDGAPFEIVVEQMKPLLGLLYDGVYCLWDTYLYPTDGNGNLFWDYPNDDDRKSGSCIYYMEDGEWGSLIPHFMYATQPRKLFNMKRADYYRDKKDSRAIAYYMDGNITALLDGHHKAMAAAMEHRQVRTVVISRCSQGYDFRNRQNPVRYLLANYARFEVKETWPDQIKKEELPAFGEKVNSFTAIDYVDDTEFSFDTKALASVYPDVADCAVIDKFDEGIDDALIDRYIEEAGRCDASELCYLIQALGAMDHSRFFELADAILHTVKVSNVLLHVVRQIGKQIEKGRDMGVSNIKDYLIEYMTEIEGEFPEVGKEIFSIL